MTTLVAPGRVVSARLHAVATADAVAAVGLTTLVALLALGTWRTWGDLGADTGYDLLAAARLRDGELPYRDFTYYYGPLGPFALAALGGTLNAALVLGVACATFIVGATYALARTQVTALPAFLAASITAALAFAPNNFSFVLPHTFSASLGLAAILALLLAVSLHAQRARDWKLVAAGVAVGLTALTRPEFALAAYGAASFWLVLRARDRQGGRREALLVALPGLCIPAVVYGAVLTYVSPHRLLLENLYPREELAKGGNDLLSAYAPLSVDSFATLAARAALYGLGAALLLVLATAIARPGRVGRAATVAAVVGAVGAAAAALARPETMRYGLEFVYGWIPVGAVAAVVVLALRFARRQGSWTPELQIATAAALVLLVLASKTYAAFLFHAPEAQLAVYAAPFAAILLVRLHTAELARTRAAVVLGTAWVAFLAAAGVGLTLKDARAETATVRGAGGSLTELPAEAPVFNAALAAISRETRPGDAILLAPQLTTLYVLAGRANALPQLSLLPGALPTAADERRAIGRLESADVRLAVVDRRPYSEYGQTAFGGSFDRLLDAWIRKSFVRERVLRGTGSDPRTLVVWVRRSG